MFHSYLCPLLHCCSLQLFAVWSPYSPVSPPSSLTSSLSPLSQTEENSQEKDCITASVSYSVSWKTRDKNYCDWTPESPFQSDELMASTSQIPTYPPSPAQNRTDGSLLLLHPPTGARAGISQECSSDLSLLCPPRGICHPNRLCQAQPDTRCPLPAGILKHPAMILTARPHLSQSKTLPLHGGIHPPQGRRGDFSSLIGTFPN